MSEQRAEAGFWRAARAAIAAATTTVSTLAVLAIASPARAEEAPPQDDGSPREVVRTAGGFSIHASHADMPKLLRALGSEAGFTVLDTGKFQLPITVAVDDLPLDMAIRRLLRDANFIVVYRGGKRGTEISTDGIEQIILLSPAGARDMPPPAPGSPLAGQHVAPGQQPIQPNVPAARARRLRRQSEVAAVEQPAMDAAVEAEPVPIPQDVVPGIMAPPQSDVEHGEIVDAGSLGMAGAVGGLEYPEHAGDEE